MANKIRVVTITNITIFKGDIPTDVASDLDLLGNEYQLWDEMQYDWIADRDNDKYPALASYLMQELGLPLGLPLPANLIIRFPWD